MIFFEFVKAVFKAVALHITIIASTLSNVLGSVVALILIVSCYTFANTKLKTKDNYFRGFPAVWNIVIFYLFLLWIY